MMELVWSRETRRTSGRKTENQSPQLARGEDGVGGFGKSAHREIRRSAEGFVVAEIDKNCADAGALAAVNVTPAVADHPRPAEIEIEEQGGVGQHARGGFATVVLRVVEALPGGVAHLDVRQGRDEPTEFGVHRIDDGGGLGAAADVGLVGSDDENVAGGGEGGASLGNTGEELELGKGVRWVGFAVADDLAVQGAVAIEENGGTEGAGG